MRALDRKLLRDVMHLRGQVLTIALVIAVGIASYITLESAWRSLSWARDGYYEETRFADAFVRLEHAPKSATERLEAIPGVAVVDARVAKDVMIPMPDLPEPAGGRLIGLPVSGQPPLDTIVLRSGRMPSPGREDEAVVLESFVDAHRLRIDDTIPVVVNGVLRDVRVVGTAMSPEYVFAIALGSFTADAERFAVLWMDERAVAAAFRMEGAFDDVAVRFQPGANEREVLDRIDDVLRPYGGMGAIPRARQPSNYVLEGELGQLRSEATLSLLFMTVAAFLLNVVLTRLVQLQRGEIAVIKAIGYRRRDIGLHFLWLAGVIVVVGSALGVAMGALLGRGMLALYAPFFHFPALALHLDASIVSRALLASAGAGIAGALGAVMRVVRLPPAEAMRPEAPPTYRPTLLERLGAGRLFEPAGRMVFRELVRRPMRTALNVLGVALAVAVAITGRISYDMVDVLMRLEFEDAQREDLMVGFRQALPDAAVREVAHLPGVTLAEPMRMIPVRLRAGARAREIAITAYPEDTTLRRIVTFPPRDVRLPDDGLLLTTLLAERLGVHAGDRVTVEILEGAREVKTAFVRGTVDDLLGLNAYISLSGAHALLGEAEGVTAALVSVDRGQERALEERLKQLPNVASVNRHAAVREKFDEQNARALFMTSLVLTVFGVVVAVGVVYNAARVALSTRARDLATLRVLGFTQREVNAVIIGELVAYVVLAVVPGLWLGQAFVRSVMSASEENFRMPVSPSGLTFAFAIAVTIAATIVSAMLVRSRVARLDMVGVLKAPE